MVNKKEIITVLNILEKSHGLTMLEQLKEYTPFQLLVATLLSSRTKDSTTIPIVKEMFKKYSNPEDFVDIEVEELEKMLYGIGFYRTKAKHVKELAKIVIEKFGGGPVGVSTLAAATAEEIDTLEDVYEPYLMQCGYLHRTPKGRMVTKLAYELLS